jgi:hypothetical protein
MRQWVLDAEHILDGSWAKPGERLSNREQWDDARDRWRKQLAHSLREGSWTPVEQACLKQFLHVLENRRPHLILCYDREQFPRTNNDMEGSIRGLKTRYRRISGRKNWNSYATRAMAGLWPTMTGGNSKPRGSKSFEKPANASAMNAGGGCANRPRRPKASNSSAFAFATSVRPIWPPLRNAGGLLLRRLFCPDGFFPSVQWRRPHAGDRL